MHINRFLSHYPLYRNYLKAHYFVVPEMQEALNQSARIISAVQVNRYIEKGLESTSDSKRAISMPSYKSIPIYYSASALWVMIISLLGVLLPLLFCGAIACIVLSLLSLATLTMVSFLSSIIVFLIIYGFERFIIWHKNKVDLYNTVIFFRDFFPSVRESYELIFPAKYRDLLNIEHISKDADGNIIYIIRGHSRKESIDNQQAMISHEPNDLMSVVTENSFEKVVRTKKVKYLFYSSVFLLPRVGSISLEKDTIATLGNYIYPPHEKIMEYV